MYCNCLIWFSRPISSSLNQQKPWQKTIPPNDTPPRRTTNNASVPTLLATNCILRWDNPEHQMCSPPKKPWKIFTANLIYKNSTSKKRGSTMRWTILPPPWLLNFQPLNLQGAELFRSLKTGSKHIAGNHQACFGGPKSTPPGFPRSPPLVGLRGLESRENIGQDMIKDLATKTSKVSKMSKKCEKKVKRGRRSFFFWCFFCLSCTCQQENLGPTKNHVQIWRVVSPL